MRVAKVKVARHRKYTNKNIVNKQYIVRMIAIHTAEVDEGNQCKCLSWVSRENGKEMWRVDELNELNDLDTDSGCRHQSVHLRVFSFSHTHLTQIIHQSVEV